MIFSLVSTTDALRQALLYRSAKGEGSSSTWPQIILHVMTTIFNPVLVIVTCTTVKMWLLILFVTVILLLKLIFQICETMVLLLWMDFMKLINQLLDIMV